MNASFHFSLQNLRPTHLDVTLPLKHSTHNPESVFSLACRLSGHSNQLSISFHLVLSAWPYLAFCRKKQSCLNTVWKSEVQPCSFILLLIPSGPEEAGQCLPQHVWKMCPAMLPCREAFPNSISYPRKTTHSVCAWVFLIQWFKLSWL